MKPRNASKSSKDGLSRAEIVILRAIMAARSQSLKNVFKANWIKVRKGRK